MHGVVSHQGVLYVVGGFDGKECLNDTWASICGERWTRVCHGAAWLPRHSHRVVSDGRYIYLVGGEGSDGVAHNDVWRSVDGSLWELCCVEATWNPCYNHAVVLHSQKMKEDNDAKNEILLSGLLQAKKNGIPADKPYCKQLASYKDNPNQSVVKNRFGKNQIVGGLKR